MKVCSWDIGMKHLAYCIMEYDPDSDSNIPFPIHKWDIIDLVSNEIIKCDFNKANGQECTNLAKYFINNDNYCGTHISNYIANIKKCVFCDKNASFIINNECVCDIHINIYDNIFYLNKKNEKNEKDEKDKKCINCDVVEKYYNVDGVCDKCVIEEYACTEKGHCMIENCNKKIKYYKKKMVIMKGYCNKHKKKENGNENGIGNLKCFCLKNAIFSEKTEVSEKNYCFSHSKQLLNYAREINNDVFYLNKKKAIKCVICDKKAMCHSKINDIGYCTIHKKCFDIENDVEFKSISNVKVCINDDCDKKADYQHKMNNNYYCNKHKKEYVIEYKNNEIVRSITMKKCNQISVDEIKRILIEKLDGIPELLQVDKVLIENQPALKNPAMKAIGSTVYSYFLIRGIVDGETVKSVKYINPSNKLKVNESNTKLILEKTTADKKYKMTKQLGIQYCTKLIQHDETNLNFLNSFKKKDDLADAFLQGAHWLTIHYND
jgi:hypothetical protein